MDDKKVIYESDAIGLPPLRMLLERGLGTEGEKNQALPSHPARPGRELEIPVRRLIAHLKGESTR